MSELELTKTEIARILRSIGLKRSDKFYRMSIADEQLEIVAICKLFDNQVGIDIGVRHWPGEDFAFRCVQRNARTRIESETPHPFQMQLSAEVGRVKGWWPRGGLYRKRWGTEPNEAFSISCAAGRFRGDAQDMVDDIAAEFSTMNGYLNALIDHPTFGWFRSSQPIRVALVLHACKAVGMSPGEAIEASKVVLPRIATSPGIRSLGEFVRQVCCDLYSTA